MTPLHLAILVKWAGKLQTRKRLQKVVYLLQVSGAPFDADYTLHHYGPYSADVARLADQMVQNGLLLEQIVMGYGTQFSYELSDGASAQLAGLQNAPEMTALQPFEMRARELLNRDLKELEMGATIAYFHRSGKSWDEAVRSTAEFKKIDAGSALMRAALELAKAQGH